MTNMTNSEFKNFLLCFLRLCSRVWGILMIAVMRLWGTNYFCERDDEIMNTSENDMKIRLLC